MHRVVKNAIIKRNTFKISRSMEVNMKFKKKQVVIISIIAVIILAVAGLIIWFLRGRSTSQVSSGQSVYVSSVADIMGLSSGNGMIGRYSGVVEPQKTWKIEASSDKKVEEIYVKEGDEVKTGDKLFIYSTSEAEDSLVQADIDLERISNEIETTKIQLEELKKDKASASADDQLEYTTRIMSAEQSIKRSEYEHKSKKAEIEQLKKSIKNAVVNSEMDGVVKSINATGDDSSSYMGGETESFMTILATGSFRIKGSVNEQNMSAIVEGQPVIVHSRVDENQIWKGTLTAVDLENASNNRNNEYYYSSDTSSESSSSYPFYVDLESAEGLMLGQHVYIEMDYGQSEVKEGLWLDSYYIVQDEDEAYVWAANEKDRIEKRKITLGEYDEELMKYEIIDGLTEEDYIAFPDVTVTEGAKAEKNIDNIITDDPEGLDDSNIGTGGMSGLGDSGMDSDEDDESLMDEAPSAMMEEMGVLE